MSNNFWKKAWNFIWHDDSIWSWIVNVILAFLLIKFIVYPIIGGISGSAFPIVAVVSGSMEHDGNLDDWWGSLNCPLSGGNNRFTQESIYVNYDISQDDFREFIFKNGFNKGDVIMLKKAENFKVGDVAVFIAPGFGDPIIHRVVSTDTGITTKGDHNCNIADWEKNIGQNRLVGKAYFRIPLVGWIKIVFQKFVADPYCHFTNNFWPCTGGVK